jgi:DNA-binding response OmpR family regulator
MFSHLLSFVGSEVFTADSFTAALTIIEGTPCCLYLLDLWLPGGSGLELCRRIRAVDQQTPILFFTGIVLQTLPRGTRRLREFCG